MTYTNLLHAALLLIEKRAAQQNTPGVKQLTPNGATPAGVGAATKGLPPRKKKPLALSRPLHVPFTAPTQGTAPSHKMPQPPSILGVKG